MLATALLLLASPLLSRTTASPETSPTTTTPTPTSPGTPTPLPTIWVHNATDFVYEVPNVLEPHALVFAASLKGFPHFRVSYYNDSGDVKESMNASFSQASFTFLTGLAAVIEFNDTVPCTNSTSVVSFVGKESRWSPLRQMFTPEHNASVQVSASFTEEQFAMIISAAVYEPTNATYNASEKEHKGRYAIKYEVGFAGFPYRLENSSLAVVLVGAVDAVFEVQTDVAVDCYGKGGICVADGAAALYWKPTVELDNNTTTNITFSETVFKPSEFLNETQIGNLESLTNSSTNASEWGAAVFTVESNRSNLFFWDPEMVPYVHVLEEKVGKSGKGVGVDFKSGNMRFSLTFLVSFLLANTCALRAVNLTAPNNTLGDLITSSEDTPDRPQQTHSQLHPRPKESPKPREIENGDSDTRPPAPPVNASSSFILNQNATQFVYKQTLVENFNITLPNTTEKHRHDRSRSALTFEFGVQSFPHFRVSYFSNSDDSDDGDFTKSAFTWRSALFRIVEYNASIPAENSTSFVSFIGKIKQWSPIAVSTPVDPFSNQAYHQATSTFSSASDNFTLTLTATVVNVPFVLDGAPVRPDSVKYSLGFSGFSYKYENSSLAIINGHASADVKGTVEANCKNDGGICVGGGKGMFYWAATVLLDNNFTAPIVFDNKIHALSDFIHTAAESKSVHQASAEFQISENWGVSVFRVGMNRSNLFYWDPEVGTDLVTIGQQNLTDLSGAVAGLGGSATTTNGGFPTSGSGRLAAVVVWSVLIFLKLV
ncbi:hypothetical protein HDU98_008504 [Podochytrium sp. JEL0797]|nr:hypothetical protein HDU98_008504 [Podochytrium sp. JEL0797]